MTDVNMIDKDWEQIKYMHYNTEPWGCKYSIEKNLVFKIEEMRKISGGPISLTSQAYTHSGHTDKSQHYYGRAADIRIKNHSLLGMYLLAERMGFRGIGLYPNNGNPFIHVDERPVLKNTRYARWIGIGDGDNLEYLPFSEDNFKKYVLGV